MASSNCHISNGFIQNCLNDLASFIAQTVKDFYNPEVEKDKDNFNDYFLLQLFLNFGIRRRFVGRNLVCLNYDRKHPKYDEMNSITQLCRPLIMDLDSFRVISLGVLKGHNYSEWLSKNSEHVDSNTHISGCIVESFPAGTMVLLNPSLNGDARVYTHVVSQEVGDETGENGDFQVDASISTRNKLGTGSFHTGMTFKDMFDRNNASMNVHFENLTPEMAMDMCYVFNTRFVGEHITNVSDNTLVACYRFKDIHQCSESWINIMHQKDSEGFTQLVHNHFKDMVCSVNLGCVVDKLVEIGVGKINIPTVYEVSDYDTLSSMTSFQEHFDQGYTIWTPSGERCRVRNSKFIEARELMGPYPLSLQLEHDKYLFYRFWDLRKDWKQFDFLKYHDGFSGEYFCRFGYYETCIDAFTRDLFNWYQRANVRRQCKKSDVPRHLGPLCYQLHGLFLRDRKPITPIAVKEFVNSLDYRVYGRIFTPVS